MYLRLMIIAFVVVCADSTVNAIKCYIGTGHTKKEIKCSLSDPDAADNATANQQKLNFPSLDDIGDTFNDIVDDVKVHIGGEASSAGIGNSCFKATSESGNSLLRIYR